MKTLEILIRALLLFVLILVGFTAFFPQWLDFTDVLFADEPEKQE